MRKDQEETQQRLQELRDNPMRFNAIGNTRKMKERGANFDVEVCLVWGSIQEEMKVEEKLARTLS